VQDLLLIHFIARTYQFKPREVLPFRHLLKVLCLSMVSVLPCTPLFLASSMAPALRFLLATVIFVPTVALLFRLSGLVTKVDVASLRASLAVVFSNRLKRSK
jgi:hypothetical protein